MLEFIGSVGIAAGWLVSSLAGIDILFGGNPGQVLGWLLLALPIIAIVCVFIDAN